MDELEEINNKLYMPTHHEKAIISKYESNMNFALSVHKNGFHNMGYWADGPESFDSASKALFDFVVSSLEDDAKECVLDVGAGFGATTISLSDEHKCKNVFGIDVSYSQVEYARKRHEKIGANNNVYFQQMSATEMQFDDDVFDSVIAIDCAIHFNDRVKFLDEANRVLKKGGYLIIADACVNKIPSSYFKRSVVKALLKMWCVPESNVYGISDYRNKIIETGFETIVENSIADKVWRPASEFVMSNKFKDFVLESNDLGKYYLLKAMFKYLNKGYEEGLLDFVIYKARKI